MEKTKVVIFGDPGNGSTAIKYGDEFVKEAEEYKYLGNVEASFSAKALNNIWKGLIQPHLEYGAEVMDTSPRGSWTEAEKIMTKMERKILRYGPTNGAGNLDGKGCWREES